VDAKSYYEAEILRLQALLIPTADGTTFAVDAFYDRFDPECLGQTQVLFGQEHAQPRFEIYTPKSPLCTFLFSVQAGLFYQIWQLQESKMFNRFNPLNLLVKLVISFCVYLLVLRSIDIGHPAGDIAALGGLMLGALLAAAVFARSADLVEFCALIGPAVAVAGLVASDHRNNTAGMLMTTALLGGKAGALLQAFNSFVAALAGVRVRKILKDFLALSSLGALTGAVCGVGGSCLSGVLPLWTVRYSPFTDYLLSLPALSGTAIFAGVLGVVFVIVTSLLGKGAYSYSLSTRFSGEVSQQIKEILPVLEKQFEAIFFITMPEQGHRSEAESPMTARQDTKLLAVGKRQEIWWLVASQGLVLKSKPNADDYLSYLDV
jgi:hypothetical protein